MADINMAFIKLDPINELEHVADPLEGKILFTEGGTMKTTDLSVIKDYLSSGIIGNLKISDNKPLAEDVGKYELSDFGTYVNLVPIIAFGTTTPTNTPIVTDSSYINSVFWDGVNFTQLRSALPQATQFIPAFNGSTFPLVSTIGNPVQRIYSNSTWELSPGQTALVTDVPGISDKWVLISKDGELEKRLFDFSTYGNISSTVANNGNAASIFALNDFPSPKTGIISKIKGRFPAIGNLKIFIANNKRNTSTPFVFRTRKVFDVPITVVGINEIDISHLNIEITQGEYVGVSNASTSKPYYGTDNTVGFGWYQNNNVTPTEGVDLTLSYANATFAFSFIVRESKVLTKTEGATKTEVVLKADRTDVFGFEKQYTLPVFTGNPSSVSLGNNIPASKDGFIKRIRIVTNAAGVVRFQLFERMTATAVNPGSSDTFKAKATFDLTVVSGDNTYDLPVPQAIKQGDYVVISKETGTLSPMQSTAAGITHLGWWQGNDTPDPVGSSVSMIYQNGTILFEYWIESQIFESAKNIKTNIIVAVPNSEDYNSLRNLQNSITDASETNQYLILAGPRVWPEVDIKGKKWVKIIGAINGGTIIFTDPKGTMASKILPADYSYPSEAGKVMSTVGLIYLHPVFANDDCDFENLTFYAKDCKYAFHIDSPGFKKFTAKNCRIKETNCNYSIGIGARGGQEILIDQCIIESTNSNKKGIFYHNWNNQTKASITTIRRSKFKNCDYAVVDELGSNQADLFNLFNCFTTLQNTGSINFIVDKNSSGKTYWKYDGVNNEPDPVNVPYCIVVNTTGTKMINLTSLDFQSPATPLWPINTIQRDVNIIQENSIIQIG